MSDDKLTRVAIVDAVSGAAFFPPFSPAVHGAAEAAIGALGAPVGVLCQFTH